MTDKQKPDTMAGFCTAPLVGLLSGLLVDGHQVIHAGLIATAEAFLVIGFRAGRDVRMAIFIAVVDVGTAVIVVVLSGAFDSVVIALLLNVTKFFRWRVPSGFLSKCCSGSRGKGYSETWCCKGKSQ